MIFRIVKCQISAEEEMDLKGLAQQKVAHGEALISSLSKFSDIEGVQKLHRKIKQELSFLKKVRL